MQKWKVLLPVRRTDNCYFFTQVDNNLRFFMFRNFQDINKHIVNKSQTTGNQ